MTTQRKILFLVPTLKRGGAETQLVSLTNQLSADAFECHISSFDDGLDQLSKINTSIKFHHFPRKRKYDINTAKSIAAIIDREKIDIVHCTLQISLFFGWTARLLSKRKPRLLTTIHTTLNRDFRSEAFDWIVYQWIMRCCDKIVFVCDAQRKHWEEKWSFIKKKSVVVHNGVDPLFFQRGSVQEDAQRFRSTHNIPKNTKVVTHIAGFRPEKGHKILITAFKKVLKEKQNALLIFAGDGALRKECEALTQEENMSPYVRFIGNVSDVRPLLENSDIAVIPSTAETFSMAMLEAMSMNIPLVATDIGGTREAVIPQRTGWLVAPSNPSALAQALTEALANEALRNQMADACRQKVLEDFTLDKMTSGYENLFLKAKP